jgi:hypothetical protein
MLHRVWAGATVVAAFFLLSGSALASLCTWQQGNRPGDIMETYVDFIHQGTSGFRWNLYIDGMTWSEYGVTRLGGSENCLHRCLPIRFTARVSNVYLHVDVTSGNASGWRCALPTTIVGHDSTYDRTPIPQWKKDLATANANYLASGKTFFSGVVGAACVAGVSGLVCKTAAGIVVFLDHAEQQQRKFAADPWDPHFNEPYEGIWPSFESLGIYQWYPTQSEFMNAVAGNIQRLVSLGDFIYVTANRVSSCQMAGNWDCAEWQQYRLDWGLVQFGMSLNDAAENLWGIAWVLENQYRADPALVAKIRELAATEQWAAQGYMQ